MKKCLPTLLYAMEVCPLNFRLQALDYIVDSALKKIFETNSKEIILECRLRFDLNSIGDVLLKRQRNFLLAYRDFIFRYSVFQFTCLFVYYRAGEIKLNIYNWTMKLPGFKALGICPM